LHDSLSPKGKNSKLEPFTNSHIISNSNNIHIISHSNAFETTISRTTEENVINIDET